MSDVLFQITEENLETGLRGYPVGYCNTSHVDPLKGLFYIDLPVQSIAYWEPERVIYLLYHGKEASADELKAFKDELKKRSTVNPELKKHLTQLPKKGHAAKLLCEAFLILGAFETTNDYREDCLNLIAKIPEIVAIVINHHAGWGGTNESKPELGYVENFVHMLKVPNGNTAELVKILKVFHVLHMDHGGGNLSTFVGKAVASGLEDMYGSICAAMTALAGPKHGKANQDCLEFVELLLNQLGENATQEEVEKLLKERLDNKELIYGFGHAVLRIEDPRAMILYDIAKKDYPNFPLVKIALLLRDAGTKVLKENPKITDPYPNVDSISGTVLSAAGFPYPEYFTVLFGWSRMVGIAIQIVYERCLARGGKGTPIVRPKYFFKKIENK
ncbi:Citrate synthase [Candidatus Rubidus massiliensis]|nr:Citrate synthase [Candidatus Rubidus massiliensis]